MTAPACKCKVPPCGPILHRADCPKVQPYSISAPVSGPENAESYFDVVRSMTDDPEVLAAVDRTEAEVTIDGQKVVSTGRIPLGRLTPNSGIYRFEVGQWYAARLDDEDPSLMTFIPIEQTVFGQQGGS